MRKIISAKKNVHFAEAVYKLDGEKLSNQNYATVINLLKEISSYLSADKDKSAHLIDNAIKLVEDQFDPSSETYKKLMAKCYTKKALLCPFGEERKFFINLATEFDPTDEKYFRH